MCRDRARSARRRAVTNASGNCRGSVVRGEEAGRFHEIAGVSMHRCTRCCGLSAFRDRHFNSRQPSYYEFIQYHMISRLRDESSSNFTEFHALTQAACSYML